MVFSYLILLGFLKKNKKLKTIHIFCILFFFVTQQQIYIFFLEKLKFGVGNLYTIKTNNITLKTESCLVDFINHNSLKITTNINYDLYNCTFGFLSGLGKNIFEKNIIFINNNLIELYSYNIQKLLQVVGFNIFLFLFIVCILIFLFSKKKKYIYI